MSEDAATQTRGAAPRDGAAKASARADAGGTSPMIAQYWRIRREYPEALLFFRMGDFYELFFDDAAKAAATLDIALTKRGRHLGEDVPMCGVPVHSAESYLQRLIRAGFKVAICEQTEDPAEARRRGPKTVVERDVIRIVTPGTITEDALLDARRSNHLAALARAREEMAVAWIELSTGAFAVEPVDLAGLPALLERVAPAELVLPETLLDDASLGEALASLRERLTPEAAARFDSRAGERRLRELFGVASLDAFGGFGRGELAAMGGLVAYVELTQKGRVPRLAPPRRQAAWETMAIDAATRRNLELAQALDGARKASLLGVMDRTVTGAGARLLGQRLAAPLTDPAAIAERLDAVDALAGDRALRDDLRAGLARTPDLERALGRLALGRGGPRDLVSVREGLKAGVALARRLAGVADLPHELARAADALDIAPEPAGHLDRALIDEPPLVARDGGFVRAGYAAGLDEARTLRDDSRRHIAGLQTRYQDETGVASLKVRHNHVLGYYVETAPAHAGKLDREVFIHRQTMANAMRFTTVELGELEAGIARAADRATAQELEIFERLVTEALEADRQVAAVAAALAAIDVAAGLAELASERGYARPVVTAGLDFRIAGGRHPVVEALADPASGQTFVANDCLLEDDGRLWLLTGPNMAGKSTFLRQNALIAVMAQAGSFVPAASATIGAVDRLFSRVGAADDLARGRSTFMVEMVETAAILNQATDRSLVILDEIGRGTATFDGLSIAWATLEHLHETNRCRALFATHYHELTALAARLDGLEPHTMRVKEWRDNIVFLYEVGAGAADRSYGIHVARLAGLPSAAVERAEEVLRIVESGEQGSALVRLADDLPLFQAARTRPTEAPRPPRPSPVEETLAAVGPDDLSPRDALELLYRLKDLAEGRP